MTKNKAQWRYANPLLHVVRKRTTVLATQLLGEQSIDTLAGLYAHVVSPDSVDEDGVTRILQYDIEMGVLHFQPYEKPLEMIVGDWLVFDGHELAVISNHTFNQQYRVSVLRNKKERHVRRKETHEVRLGKLRENLGEGWSIGREG